MSLFQCDSCGSLENTALTDCGRSQMKYFLDDPEEVAEYKEQLGLEEDEQFGDYCSACCPLGNKKWHGKFERVYLPKGEFETAPNGNLRHKKTLEEDVRKYAIKITPE